VPLVIEPLARHHDREAFSSGSPELDAWFRRRASQDEKRNVARVFVAVEAGFGVVGFYSLGSFAFDMADLPPDLARKLPRYGAVPAALIGRLGRDIRMRGKGLGEFLLADAVKRVLGAAASLAIHAIVVDAKDERAADFYRGFGFQPFPSRPRRLFLPVASATTAFETAG
jgi:GNAT superfamily N-acetyltransferase